MADGIAITPGVGLTILSDDTGATGHAQVVKLAISTDASPTLIPATVANGMLVDASRIQGNVTVVQSTATNLKVDASGVAVPVTDNGGSLTVDAPVGTPAFVRLSDGTAAISALPITDNSGSLTVDAPVTTPAFVRLSDGTNAITALPITDNSGSVTVDAPVGTPAFVRLSDGTNPITALPITDNSGSLTVDGTVTANQGTPVAVASAWPVKVSDGTDTVGISTVSGAKAMKVDVVQSVGSSVQVDKTGFTEGTGSVQVAGAVFNDTIVGDPAEDQATALRITAKKGLHVNIRNASGTEIATATNPIRTDPTGTTNQPTLDTNSGAILTAVQLIDDPVGATGSAIPAKAMVAGGTDGTNTRAMAVTASGLVKVDDGGGSLTVDQGVSSANPWQFDFRQVAGTTHSDTNPLKVSIVSQDRTQARKAVALTAGQTAVTVWDPDASKKFVILGGHLTITGSGTLQIFDQTNSATTQLYQGTPPVGAVIDFNFTHPWISAAIDNILKYTSGAGLTGDVSLWGYEIA